ncbi:MAG: hypothetical protein MUC81_02020 [Bacteroidia bacterium]|jgi:hypothetical protein|nr:hypothetical protein [Bacteroidia bacterium]
MNVKQLFIYFILALGISYQTYAQTSFSFDVLQYPNDLDEYFDKYGNSSAKDAVSEFIGYYNGGKFTNPQKILMIKLTNQMLNQNYKASPHFENYFNAINGLVANNLTARFDNWHKAAEKAFNQGKDASFNFLSMSKAVLYDKTILRTPGIAWIATDLDVDFASKSSPVILFKNTTLMGITPGDTLEIYNTTGTYNAENNIWYGKGGKTDFSRVGFDSAVVYTELRNYTLDLLQGNLYADSAMFFYKGLLSNPLYGKLVDQAMAKSLGNKSVYPKFDSYIKNFNQLSFGRAKYTGGFGMKGDEIVCKGSDSSTADLIFLFKNKPILKISASELILRSNKMRTLKAAVTIYLEKDSIFHPQLEFTYDIPGEKISLFRDKKQGVSSAPFYDSYHKVEFYCDEVKWDLNNPSINIDMINDSEPARFESVNYFRDIRYERVQGMLAYNPLHRIKLYCDKFKVNGFSIKDYAANFKSDPSSIRLQMIELNDYGFVDFNEKKDYVTIKRKLKDYVNAHFGNTDYDAITFLSVIGKQYPNASISLINNDLNIEGVPQFYFSDSQNVYIVPRGQQVTLKKNRNMDFSGKLRAGKADFYGNGFTFDYTTFQVRLNNVDSMKFLYKDDKTGADLPIKSALQNIYGTLAIDHPNNKSGRKKFPGYPIFKSDVGSKVYYDKPSTQNGVYNRNRFYFDVEPFTMDSLNELDLEKMSLAGTLVSGGIIPDLKYALYLQPDKSLGFKLKRNEAGYPMYEGKGRGFIDLSLSDEGFFGTGELNYLASVSKSTKFVMLLDSLNGMCESFVNKRTEVYPDVVAKNTYTHWMPYRDTMLVTRTDELIDFSKNRAKLDGTIIYTPGAMHARGNINVEQAQLTSNDFWLQPDQVLSEDARFKLFDLDDDTKFAFSSASVKARIDLDNRLGDFKSITPGLNTFFNYNNYAGAFDEFFWRMDPKTIDFKSSNPESNKTFLVSVHPTQDSLKFNTTLTTLTIRDFTMYAKKIPYIAVGDAKVFPDSNKAIIRAAADMDILDRAKIVADTINKFHNIDSVSIKISGRFNVSGTGKYQYVDKNKTVQKFYLNEIKINKLRQLMAKSNIPDSVMFFVGPKIQFRGDAVLISVIKNLEYDGYFLPIHTLPMPKTEWFKNAAVVNPDSVYINVKSPIKNMVQQTIQNGFNISNDSAHVYSLFFSRKRNQSDPELLKVEGTLFYDEKEQAHRMGEFNKLFGKSPKGNLMVVNDKKKTIYGEGRYRLGFESTKFTVAAAGNSLYNLNDTTFKMNLVMLLNFALPQSAIRLMFDTLTEQSASAEVPKFDAVFLSKALAELVEDKNIKKVVEEIEEDGTIRLINDLEKTIFISEIMVRWNQATRSLVSEGDIGINSFDKYKFERKVKGKMELVKRRSGDDFTLYIQSVSGSWYYFKFQKGVMYTVSSDPLYNSIIKDNIDKFSKQDDYKLRLANISVKNQFLKAGQKK